jgi:hypothetical protein
MPDCFLSSLLLLPLVWDSFVTDVMAREESPEELDLVLYQHSVIKYHIIISLSRVK